MQVRPLPVENILLVFQEGTNNNVSIVITGASGCCIIIIEERMEDLIETHMMGPNFWVCRYGLEHITSSFIHQSINIFNLRLDQSMKVMQCTVGWFGKDVAIIDMSLRFVPLDDK